MVYEVQEQHAPEGDLTDDKVRGPRKPRGIEHGGLAYTVLSTLADEGPTEMASLRDCVVQTASESAVNAMMHSLRERRYMRIKVFLTPEGLAAIKEAGWKPEFVGLESDG